MNENKSSCNKRCSVYLKEIRHVQQVDAAHITLPCLTLCLQFCDSNLFCVWRWRLVSSWLLQWKVQLHIQGKHQRVRVCVCALEEFLQMCLDRTPTCTFTVSHLADAFIQSSLPVRNISNLLTWVWPACTPRSHTGQQYCFAANNSLTAWPGFHWVLYFFKSSLKFLHLTQSELETQGGELQYLLPTVGHCLLCQHSYRRSCNNNL